MSAACVQTLEQLVGLEVDKEFEFLDSPVDFRIGVLMDQGTYGKTLLRLILTLLLQAVLPSGASEFQIPISIFWSIMSHCMHSCLRVMLLYQKPAFGEG